MSASDLNPRASTSCALVSRACREDPIGMASSYQHLVAVEQPLPWSEDFLEAVPPPSLSQTIEQLWNSGIPTRVLAIAPDTAYAQPGLVMVLHVRRPDGPFAVFEKDEYLVPAADAWHLAEALITEQADPYRSYRRPSADVRDLLVCTHGSVDACCGKFGIPLYQHLRDSYAASDLRIWRCSHFGGHRFAPTLLDLPDGRFWGYLSPQILEPLIYRTGPIAALRGYYRGWGGFDSVFAQVAEREIWLREGWAWLDYHKSAYLLAIDPVGTISDYPQFEERPPQWAEIQIDYTAHSGGITESYVARLEIGRTVEIGGCHEGSATVQQYHVARLHKLPMDQAITST